MHCALCRVAQCILLSIEQQSALGILCHALYRTAQSTVHCHCVKKHSALVDVSCADEDDDLTGGGDTEDEGIEGDEEEEEGGGERRCGVRRSGAAWELVPLCRHHLALPTEAEAHYRAVCRLVTQQKSQEI